MIQPRIVREAVQRFAGAGLGIGAAEDDERQPGLNNGAGAHGTRFEGDVENAMVQSPRLQRLRRLGEGDHFGMGGRIAQLLTLIVRAGDDAVFKRNDNGAVKPACGGHVSRAFAVCTL